MSTGLSDVVELVMAGEQPTDTVRNLLRRFGFERRGYHKVRHVRKALEASGLVTDPDFNNVSIDSLITYRALTPESTPEVTQPSPPASFASSTGALIDAGPTSTDDPAYRMRRLEDVTQALVSIAPDEDLRRAVTLMMSNDYSQLPVMTGARTVRGIISWRSIGRCYSLGRAPALVRDAMESEVVEIDAEVALFAAIPRIVANDYALVKRADATYWIVTTSDLSVRFKELAEPFLLLSEIENQLRWLLDEHVSRSVLEGARDPEDESRTIESAADLTLGEIIRLLEQPVVWDRLAPRLDRVEVVKRVDEIRTIRNDVMHFDPEGVGPSDLAALRAFAQFLQDVRQWLPSAPRVTGTEPAEG